MSRYQQANYSKSLNQEFAGNPFIEALPRRLSSLDFWESVEELVDVPENINKLDTESLEQISSRILDSVCPTSLYYDVYCDILNTLKTGYSRRNPKDANTQRWQNQVATATHSRQRTTAPSIKFTGYSGMGKTTLVDSVLRLIPPVIEHPTGSISEVKTIQIVYIKVNIPGDSNAKQICLSIFAEIDKVLGTSYRDEFEKSRVTFRSCIDKLVTLSSTLLIGMFIFDELQNVCLARPNEQKKLFTFFDRLTNEARVPTVKIGTSKSNRLTNSEFTNARRLGIPIEWKNFICDHEDWLLLVEYVWDYQLLPNFTELTTEIQRKIYEVCQGIVHCLFFLIEQCNIVGIRRGYQAFSISLIDEVYKTKFSLMKPAIIALRHGKVDAFDELMNANVSVDNEIKKLFKQLIKTAENNKFNAEESRAIYEQIERYIPDFKLTKKEESIIKRLENQCNVITPTKMISNSNAGYPEIPL